MTKDAAQRSPRTFSEVVIIRSPRRRKTLSIRVNSDQAAVIRVPLRTTQAEIDRFIQDKSVWLQREILRQRELNSQRQSRSFISGERFLYLGDAYVLKNSENTGQGDALVFTGSEFRLRRDALPAARLLFHLWYMNRARVHMDERVRHFSGLLRLPVCGVAIGNAKGRWGSCSQDNRLRFCWRLIMAPRAVIDYVIVHELCHTKVRNHSRAYWRLVESILPDFGHCRKWLKDNGHLLRI
jgi:hypothetical protein